MSKIGDIYRVDALSPKRYFQLVAFDITQLNSDVIAVLPKGYQPGAAVVPNAEFFTHTMVDAGVKEGLWAKADRADPLDYSKALFKDAYYKDALPDIEPYEADHYHSWVIWRIGGEWQQIGKHVEKYPQAELGAVYPPEGVVYRIKHGKYPGVPFYGQVR